MYLPVPTLRKIDDVSSFIFADVRMTSQNDLERLTEKIQLHPDDDRRIGMNCGDVSSFISQTSE
jgi:hypothetical protein